MVKRLLAIATLIVALLGSSVSTYADTLPTQAITLSPATVQLAVDPGASITKSVDVINSGSDSFSAQLSTVPYYVTGTNYDPHFTQLPGTVDASQWVTLASSAVTVDSLKLQTVNYTVTVPKNTAPGGYYAVIFAETSEQPGQGGGVVSHNRVGNILYITVNGPVARSGALTGQKVSFFHFSPTIPLGVDVANTGGVHFNTTATISVTGITGKTLFKQSFDRIVLPQTVRNISTSWAPTTPIGIYTVHRQATIAGTLKTLPDSTFMVISPWFLVGVVAILLVLLALLGRWIRHRRAQRK